MNSIAPAFVCLKYKHAIPDSAVTPSKMVFTALVPIVRFSLVTHRRGYTDITQ